MKLNIAAPLHPPIMSLRELRKKLDGNTDFMIVDISHPNNGAYTTGREMRERGVKTVQVRYGRRHEKVWYGNL